MGETTVVDTAALVAAARAASARSRDVLAAAGATGPPLARFAAELPGAQSAPPAAALRQAAITVLGELGQALDGWCRLLQAAAGGYADAERRASPTAPAGGGAAR